MSNYLGVQYVDLELRTKVADAALAVAEAQLAVAICQKSKKPTGMFLHYCADVEVAEAQLKNAVQECARAYVEGA